MIVVVDILGKNEKQEVEVSRVPCKGEYIELSEGPVVEVYAVFHLANRGVGRPVAFLRVQVVG